MITNHSPLVPYPRLHEVKIVEQGPLLINTVYNWFLVSLLMEEEGGGGGARQLSWQRTLGLCSSPLKVAAALYEEIQKFRVINVFSSLWQLREKWPRPKIWKAILSHCNSAHARVLSVDHSSRIFLWFLAPEISVSSPHHLASCTYVDRLWRHKVVERSHGDRPHAYIAYAN